MVCCRLTQNKIIIGVGICLSIAVYAIWLPITLDRINEQNKKAERAYSNESRIEIKYPSCDNSSNQCHKICTDQSEYFMIQCLYSSDGFDSLSYCSTNYTCPAIIYCVTGTVNTCGTQPSPIRIQYNFIKYAWSEHHFGYASCSFYGRWCGICVHARRIYKQTCLYGDVAYCPTTKYCPSLIYDVDGKISIEMIGFFDFDANGTNILIFMLPLAFLIMAWPMARIFPFDMCSPDYKETYRPAILLLLLCLVLGVCSILATIGMSGGVIVGLIIGIPIPISFGFYLNCVIQGTMSCDVVSVMPNLLGVAICWSIGFPMAFLPNSNSSFTVPFGIYCLVLGFVTTMVLLIGVYVTFVYKVRLLHVLQR